MTTPLKRHSSVFSGRTSQDAPKNTRKDSAKPTVSDAVDVVPSQGAYECLARMQDDNGASAAWRTCLNSDLLTPEGTTSG